MKFLTGCKIIKMMSKILLTKKFFSLKKKIRAVRSYKIILDMKTNFFILYRLIRQISLPHNFLSYPGRSDSDVAKYT